MNATSTSSSPRTAARRERSRLGARLPRPSRRLRLARIRGARILAAAIVGCAALVALPPAAAVADEVKVGGFWVRDVAIRSVRDGKLYFRSPTGATLSRPLDAIEGIRIDAYPALEKGRSSFDAADYNQAVEQFKSVADNARVDWLQAYARARMVESAARAEMPVIAAQTFLQLVSSDPESALVPDPPVEAVRSAPDAARRTIERSLSRSIAAVPDAHREAVRQLIEAAGVADAEVGGEQPDGAGPADGGAAPAAGGEAAPTRNEGAVTLPASFREDEEINRLLLAGEFKRAERLARDLLASPGGTSRELYQLGMALLGQAEASGDAADFKTAALPFMRVVIHFGGGSRVVNYARAEAAYCHHRFGRDDLASGLLNRARNDITEEDDPAYAERVGALIRAVEGGGS